MALRAGYYGIKKALLRKLEALTNAVVIKSIGDGLNISAAGELSSTSTGGFDYSTTEVDTGQKWIDGSIIYSITYAFETPISTTSGTWVDVADNTDINLILDSVIRGTDNFQTLPGAAYNNKTSGKIQIIQVRGANAAVQSATIWYTKEPLTSSTKKTTKKTAKADTVKEGE